MKSSLMSLHLCGFAISVTIRMEHVKSENQGKKLSYEDTQSKKKKPRSDHRCLDSWPRTLIVLKAGLMSNNLHYCIPHAPPKAKSTPRQSKRALLSCDQILCYQSIRHCPFQTAFKYVRF